MKTRQWLGIVTLLVAGAVCAQAQTYTWDGGASGDRWNEADNWEGGAEPSWGDTVDLVWHSVGAGSLDSVLGNINPEFRSLTFNSNVNNAMSITLRRIATTDARNITQQFSL